MNNAAIIAVKLEPGGGRWTAKIVTGLSEQEAEVFADLDKHGGRYLRDGGDALKTGRVLIGSAVSKAAALKQLEAGSPGAADRFAAEVARRRGRRAEQERRAAEARVSEAEADESKGHGWGS